MSGVPKWSDFRTRKVPTSDSEVPDSQISRDGETIAVRICKVCKQPLIEGEKYIVCGSCGHYAHAEHSQNYNMAPHDNLCVVELIGVSKRSYKLLYGLMKKRKLSRIRKAAAFSDSEFNQIRAELIQAKLLVSKSSFGVINKLKVTSLALEVSPMLEDIYSNEKDVHAFVLELEAA